MLYNNEKEINIKEYHYKINGNKNECYECSQNNNILKIYYLHYNIIYKLYNCKVCMLSDDFIKTFGIKIINNKKRLYINKFLINIFW